MVPPPSEKDHDTPRTVFHVTLADPSMYKQGTENNTSEYQQTLFPPLEDPNLYRDGTHTQNFTVKQKGEYTFRFVPNGSSPETLSITLTGEDGFVFSEDFILQSTEHQALGSAVYYTWEYNGEHIVTIPYPMDIIITIDPNGNTQGSVSVYVNWA